MALYSNGNRPTSSGLTEEERNRHAAKVPGTVTVRPVVANTPTSSGPSQPLGRKLFDGAAWASDKILTPPKAVVDGVNRTLVGARNLYRTGVGLQPVEPMEFNYNANRDRLASVRAANTEAAKPAAPIAPNRPVSTPAAPPAVQPSRNMAAESAASQREVQAQNQQPASASPPALPQGARADGVTVTKDRNGNNVYSNSPTPITVNQQNFGTAPVNPAIGSRPQVASTFGQSVRTMQDDNAVAVQRPQVALRSADKMSEVYASREAREAQKKMLSDLDSQRFRLEMIAQNPGRRGRAALEALGRNATQQEAIVNGMAGASAGAVQGRAERDSRAGIAGMQEQGQNFRTLLDAGNRMQIAGMQDATTREGQQLGHQAALAGLNRPQYFADGKGSYYRTLPDGSAAVVNDQAGNPITMPQGQGDNSYANSVMRIYEAQMKNSGEMGQAHDPQKAWEFAEQSARRMYDTGQQRPTLPDRATFDAELKKRNPTATQAQLDAEWRASGGK